MPLRQPPAPPAAQPAPSSNSPTAAVGCASSQAPGCPRRPEPAESARSPQSLRPAEHGAATTSSNTPTCSAMSERVEARHALQAAPRIQRLGQRGDDKTNHVHPLPSRSASAVSQSAWGQFEGGIVFDIAQRLHVEAKASTPAGLPYRLIPEAHARGPRHASKFCRYRVSRRGSGPTRPVASARG